MRHLFPTRARLAVALAAFAAAASTTAVADDEYVILFQGKESGQQTVQVDDGRVVSDFSFRNNGRGPDLHEEYELAEDGGFRRYQASGKSMFGAEIDDRYERSGGKAVWTAPSGSGERALDGPATYVPVEFSPATMGALVRAALANDGSVSALPGGTLSVERLLTTGVVGPEGSRDVALYAVSGLGFTPTMVWMTQDAEPELFAFIYPGWVQAVGRGWEAQAQGLEERQVEAEHAMLRDFARRYAHPMPGTTVIRNARVFDSENATLGEPSDVYISGDRIAAIYPAGSEAKDVDREIDAAGRVLLPGLFDMHVHAGNWDVPLHLAAGVTSARDLSNDNARLAQMIGEIERGELLGPRIVAAGFIEGESPYSARGGIVIANLDQARDAIDWYAQHGFRQIKIYNSFPRDILPQAVEYAHSRGLRVSGHVPAFMRAEEVVRAGYDELQHINQVMLNFLVKPEDDTRTLKRFYLVSEGAHALDLDGREVQDFIALLREKNVVVDPTLAVFEDMAQRQGEPGGTFAPIVDHLPASMQRSVRTTSFDVPEDKVATYRASYDAMRDMVVRMHRAGVPLVAGTDATPGFTLHRELELYVEGGIPAAQALRIATWNGARYTGQLDRLGSIAPGKLADLVLLEADPLEDISAVRRPVLVIKGGTAYYPDELHQALGVRPFAASVRPTAVADAR